MLNKIFILLIIAASIFISSKYFVDTINTPQLYSVLLISLLAININILTSKNVYISSNSFKNNYIIGGVFIICIIKTLLVSTSLIKCIPNFSIAESFDNSAGFACLNCLGYTFGLFLLNKVEKQKKYFLIFGLVLILFSILFIRSRTGILALTTSSIVFFLIQNNFIKRIKKLKLYKSILIIITSVIVSIISVFSLYKVNKASADGRLLIWKVSISMFKEHPLLGYGVGSFQSKYMDYQAEYFRLHDKSKHSLLADNVKVPFNEFIKIAIEFGLIGIIILCYIIYLFFKNIYKNDPKYHHLILPGLTVLFVFSMFSYPFRFLSIKLILIYYLIITLLNNELSIKNSVWNKRIRVIVLLISVVLFSCLYRSINNQIKWKNLVTKSQNGNYKELIPEYTVLSSSLLGKNTYFLYNYGVVLNRCGKYKESLHVLTKCKKKLNDYDVQMQIANNLYELDIIQDAIKYYKNASNMIPCRFLPLYQLFNIYKYTNDEKSATEVALKIKEKEVKVQSSTVTFIKNDVKEFLKLKSL